VTQPVHYVEQISNSMLLMRRMAEPEKPSSDDSEPNKSSQQDGAAEGNQAHKGARGEGDRLGPNAEDQRWSQEAPDKGKPEEKGGEQGEKKPEKKHFRWTPAKIIGLIVLFIVVASFATYYLIYSSKHETTDDAYTTGFVHQISSRVTGNVIQLLIVDNQRVRQGQVLLQLDPRDYLVQVAKAQADYDRAMADFDRVDALKGDIAISKQDYDQTKTNMEVAKASLDDANNQLSYCTIVAPTDGYIGNRMVDVGNRVTVGGALMAVIQDVWVVANYKETQLSKMRKNQRVQITVDAIPGHTFEGHIDSFSPGTGSTFALLPPDNATGNFTKIVQRVPVKILIDSGFQPNMPLPLGLSVEPKVTVK